ncbi:MAG TPA: Ig-like domain-containing protein [Thermoanaerobaculia bacterium]|nr:Ig-like domain-containing protein [Thermoanaerobaculia bacterium]
METRRRLRSLFSSLALPLALASLGTPAAIAATPINPEYDECEADFIAFVGSDVYQFSPALPAELGSVRLFSVLSYQRAAAMGEYGRAFWRLEVRGPLEEKSSETSGTKAPIVRLAQGVARIEADGQARVEYAWNGLDAGGKPVAPGRYEYTFHARFLSDRERSNASRYEDLKSAGVDEARTSPREVIVVDRMDAIAAKQLRTDALAGVCQKQRNTPIETGFAYNFYYGSTHSHSNWSDGGQPTTNCSSGNAYGSGTFTPAAIYDYARNTAGLDYWVINEHNHLLNDAMTTNNPPVTEAKIRARYQSGLAAAATATVNDAFIAVYGMEWGVLTNPDEGHVTLLETPTLFGWETCTTCNGPSQECTTGSNCYFDIFTPKRFGYLAMYHQSVLHPSPQGALGILCHPESGQFDNFAFNADADNALQGIAVRSGIAFNTATNCGVANIASVDYVPLWQNALNRGFHLGPTADHDAHCNTYGIGMPDRTVYLLPNGATPTLTKAALLSAHKARHFFATEDANAQLVFATGTGNHIMGDIFSAAGSATLRAAVYDPDGEGISKLEIWRGQIGGGIPSAAYRSVTGTSTLSFTETLSSGTFYYYVHAVQADGNNLWSAPMWITYTAGGCSDTTAPAVAITAPASGATITCADTTITGTASDASGIQSVEVQIDGGAWSPATFNSGTGTFTFAWASSGATSGTHTLAARATDASCNHNVAITAPRSVTVDNASCNLDVSGWKLQQQNSAQAFTLPAGTKIANKGYLIVGRDATKSAFETFWRGGTPLPSNVIYVSSAGALPQINGDENYTLSNASATLIDGPTINMPSSANSTVQRKGPCLAAGTASSWTVTTITGTITGPTPGSGAGTGCSKGAVINEFSDALGTGNFIYEFVEIYNDK